MKKKVFIAIIFISIIVSVVSYFVLPEMVVIQVGFDGEASTVVNKLFAILIPLVITLVGDFMYYKNDNEQSKKGIALSIVGIILFVIEIFMNR